MPQDTGFIQITAYDSAGNAIAADSLPEDLQELRHEILHRREVEQIERGKYPDSRDDSYLPFLMIALFLVVVVRARRKDNRMHEEEQAVTRFASSLQLPEKRSYLVYPGKTLHFGDPLLAQVLVKYFPYFNRLQTGERSRFLQRLR